MSYDDDYPEEREQDDEEGEDTVESTVWRLLELLNPGDQDSALLQFSKYRDEAEDQGEDEPMRLVIQVTNWQSTFEVDADDTRELVDAINELTRRWSEVAIDWKGDPDDDEFHEDIDGAEIFNRAFDELKPHEYTLWSMETDDDTLAGWITLSRDDEEIRHLATVLGINIRLGSQVA